jgi:hypothetical protein
MSKRHELKGKRFTAVGYGHTERTHEPGSGAPVFGEAGTRRYAVSSFGALNKNFLRLSQNPSTEDAGACFGDSGGPNFLGAHERDGCYSVDHHNGGRGVPGDERHLPPRHAVRPGVP